MAWREKESGGTAHTVDGSTMTPGWKTRLKSAAAECLYRSGALRLCELATRGQGIILAYHRVLPADSDDLAFVQPGMYVTTETFETHIAYVMQHYRVMALQDLSSKSSENACVITFDDGWLDNYLWAFPILRRYGVPATIFLATGMIGTTEWPWPDRVCYYIHHAPLEKLEVILNSALRKEAEGHVCITGSADDRYAIAELVLRRLKRLENQSLGNVMDDIDRRFSELRQLLNNKRPWLAWDEVLEMSRHQLSFGSHTSNHVILTQVPISEARAEIRDSRRTLTERLGRPVTAFCYPNGDFTPELARIVAESGYDVAVTTTRGTIDGSSSRLALNRIMIHEDMTNTVPMFASMLTNVVPFF